MYMLKRLLLNTAILMLSTLMAGSLAHAWSEPAIAPIMMASPLTPPPVTGTTYYVDKSNLGGTCNNNNPGTKTQPWCTIGKAMATLTAGQQVLVRAGTYNEGNLKPTNSGTPGNYITIRRYPGENPVINCTGNTWCLDGWSAGARSYIVWDGFEMTGPNQQFFSTTAPTSWNHIWLINNKFHDNNPNFHSAAIQFDGTNFIFSNNEMYNLASKAVGASKVNAHEIIYEFNHIHNTGAHADDDGGLKCGDAGTSNCIMRYNHIHDNHRDPSSTEPCFTPGTCQGVTGLYIDQVWNPTGSVAYVYNNIVHDNDIGIQVWDSQHVHVFNNVVYNNGFGPGTFLSHFGYGITVDWPATADVHVYNNTVYGNRNAGIDYGSGPSGAITSRNNLVMNNGTPEVRFNGGSANANFNYDLIADTSGGNLIFWNGTNYSSLSSFLARGGNTTWTHAVSSPAQFVNAAASDFHPQATSPSIEAGSPVSLFNFALENSPRPEGSAWDIGAYEYGSGNISLSAPTNLRIVP